MRREGGGGGGGYVEPAVERRMGAQLGGKMLGLH